MSTTETKLTVEDLAHYYYMLRAELLHSAELRKMLDRLFVAARASLEAKGAWEPIETAPKDGTWILVYAPEAHEVPVRVVMWVSHSPQTPWRCGPGGYLGHDVPKFWMPLPPPPSTGTGGQRHLTLEEQRGMDRALRRSGKVIGSIPTQGRDAAEGECEPCPTCNGRGKQGNGRHRRECPDCHGYMTRAAYNDFKNFAAPNVSTHEQERKENVPEQDLELPVGVRGGQHLRDSDAQPANLTPTDRETISELVECLISIAHNDYREPDPTGGEYFEQNGRTIVDAASALTRLIDENRALEKDVAAYKESNSVWAKTVADLQSQLAAAKEELDETIKAAGRAAVEADDKSRRDDEEWQKLFAEFTAAKEDNERERARTKALLSECRLAFDRINVGNLEGAKAVLFSAPGTADRAFALKQGASGE